MLWRTTHKTSYMHIFIAKAYLTANFPKKVSNGGSGRLRDMRVNDIQSLIFA